MKHLKFFTVALTLLMGVTFTSCLNSDDNGNTVDAMHFALVKNYMGFVFFEDALGQRITPSAASVAKLEANTTAKISDYQFGMIYYNYPEGVGNSSTGTTSSTDVELVGFAPCDYGYGVEAFTEEDFTTVAPETAPVITLNLQGMKPFQFNPSVIVLPLAYYMENKAEALKQHKFALACAVEEIESSDTNLVLYLRHDRGTDEKVEAANTTYYAYDIEAILAIFKAKTGKAPVEIVIKAHELGEYGNASLNIPGNYTDYSITYKEVITAN